MYLSICMYVCMYAISSACADPVDSLGTPSSLMPSGIYARLSRIVAQRTKHTYVSIHVKQQTQAVKQAASQSRVAIHGMAWVTFRSRHDLFGRSVSHSVSEFAQHLP